MNYPEEYIKDLQEKYRNKTVLYHKIRTDYLNYDTNAIELCKSIDGDDITEHTFQKATHLVFDYGKEKH